MKITRSMLRTLVREAMQKFGDERSTEDAVKDTEEVDAKDVAKTLEKQIDYVKALKLEERRLLRRLRSVRGQMSEASAQKVRKAR